MVLLIKSNLNLPPKLTDSFTAFCLLQGFFFKFHIITVCWVGVARTQKTPAGVHPTLSPTHPWNLAFNEPNLMRTSRLFNFIYLINAALRKGINPNPAPTLTPP